MATWLTRIHLPREPPVSFLGQTAFEALAQAIDIRRLHLTLFLICLRLKLFVFDFGDPRALIGGSSLRHLFQTLAQQQQLANIYLSLDQIQAFQLTCLEIFRYLGYNSASSFKRPIYQFQRDSCRNKFIYILARLLYASGRLPTPGRRLTPFSSSAGAADLEEFNGGRRSPQRLEGPKAVPDDHPVYSNSGRNESQVPLRRARGPSSGQKSIVDVEDTSVQSHLAERSLSQPPPEQSKPAPPTAPPTSARAPHGCSATARALGASSIETALAHTPPNPSLIPTQSEVFSFNANDSVLRHVECTKQVQSVFADTGTHRVPTVRSLPLRPPPVALKDTGTLSTQHSIPGAECGRFVNATGESQGKRREGGAPQKSAGGQQDNRGKRKAATNSTHPPTSDGLDDDETEDENRDPRSNENHPVKKMKALGPQFKCPKYAADPGSCNPKCEDWGNSNVSISQNL
jgi:hypothetical protein